ncbi:Hypothetical predicted protein [Cloeon dipterum]|uniref:Transmembrane protein n=1 Tax=Cloeon dipterum TaxID=197152 RepID=A0A8S1DH12_9INSE|nr:Hypothetical predicted protein [Cloeon dipterum]
MENFKTMFGVGAPPGFAAAASSFHAGSQTLTTISSGSLSALFTNSNVSGSQQAITLLDNARGALAFSTYPGLQVFVTKDCCCGKSSFFGGLLGATVSIIAIGTVIFIGYCLLDDDDDDDDDD